MKKKIIAIFRDASLLLSHAEALRKAGHEVCSARNLLELKKHLDAGHCDVIVIGPTIPAPEKFRIANFVHQFAGDSKLVEVYESSSELSMAHATVHISGGSRAILEAIHQLF